jgi:hypothetical protein
MDLLLAMGAAGPCRHELAGMSGFDLYAGTVADAAKR